MSVADMDSRWKHPFPALVAGPMFCGKSQLVQKVKELFFWSLQGENEYQISQNYILNMKFSEFCLFFTIHVKFDIHLLL